MKKTIGLIIVIILLAVGAWLIFGKDNNPKTANTNTTASNSSKNDTSSAIPAPPTATNKVTIQNMAFAPQAITVKKGTTVTWTNQDSVQHTVTESDGKTGPNSASLDLGRTYSFTYNEAGIFSYHCTIHTDMTGTVIVSE